MKRRPVSDEMTRACSICLDSERHHVHDGDRRIENYFTVGRGQSEMDAAREWHVRATRAEREVDEANAEASRLEDDRTEAREQLEQSRERERALREALKTVAEGYSWDGMEEAELAATEMQDFAAAALAGQTEQEQ